MGYNISTFLNSLTAKNKPSAYSPFGNANTGAVGQVNSAVSGLTTPKSQYIGNATSNFTNNFSRPLATPSSAAATGTKPATPTTPQKAPVGITSSAGKTFVNNQTSNGGYSTIPGPYDPVTGKLKDAGTSNTSSENNSSATETDPYMMYLKSLFSSDAATKAGKDLTSANERLAGIQNEEEAKSVAGKHQFEKDLDTPGMLKSGAQETANLGARRTNAELADLAVQEGAAARSAQVAESTYNRYIEAGKTVYEAEQAAKKAKQEQDNADRDYNLKVKTNEQDQANIDKKFDEDKRQFGMEYALKARDTALNELKVRADIGATSSTSEAKQTEALSGMNLINSLINNPKVGAISGFIQGKLGLGNLSLSSDAQLARNQYNQIKGMLSLENRSKLKGQGAVSDFEGKMLESAASSLGRNLGDAEFINQLKQVSGAIATSHGLSANVLVRDPRTGQMGTATANSASIAKMIQDGLLVTYQ